MSDWFVDTSYLIAFVNPDDEAHDRAIHLSKDFRGRLLTTQWILIEFANALHQPNTRETAANFIHWILSNEQITTLPADDESFRLGLALYEKRVDKEWSLTDCISFNTMQGRGIAEALTGDHHFEQAGFVALLK